MAFGYYMAVPMSVGKSGVQFHVYNGSALTWRLTLIDILQSPFFSGAVLSGERYLVRPAAWVTAGAQLPRWGLSQSAARELFLSQANVSDDPERRCAPSSS